MTVLPSQKLSIGELFLSIAAGLMLFLLPNDVKNNFEASVSESCILIFSIIIILTLHFILKRFEAVGAAMLTTSVLILISTVFNIVSGIISKKENYWLSVTEYNIISMSITWLIPFLCMTVIRLFMSGYYDTIDRRKSYARFLSFSMYSLIIIYAIVIISKLILPYRPKTDMPRELNFIVFSQIKNYFYDNGIRYILFNTLIFLPISFYLLVLIPRLSWWQILIITLASGLTVEILQYAFNTGIVCIDDILMYIIGALIGCLLKHSIDKLRSALTFGQDKCMLCLDYFENNKSDNAFAVSETE